jgi:hypothetical protein
MKAGQKKSWVVYKMPIQRLPGHVNAVCEQNEWDAMELSRPGYYTLVRSGIESEGEAEQLARSATPAGD